MNKKIIMTLTVLITGAAITACGNKPKLPDDPEGIVYEINQESADAIVEEKLEGTDCSFEAEDMLRTEDNNYYIYTVIKDGDSLDEKLAVESVSGEISVYDEEAEAFYAYSEFSEYVPENDENVHWNGIYDSDGFALVINEEEPGSFVYEFYNTVEEIESSEPAVTGYAYLDNYIKATSQLYDEELTITIHGDEIEIESEEATSEYKGIYTRVEAAE